MILSFNCKKVSLVCLFNRNIFCLPTIRGKPRTFSTTYWKSCNSISGGDSYPWTYVCTFLHPSELGFSVSLPYRFVSVYFFLEYHCIPFSTVVLVLVICPVQFCFDVIQNFHNLKATYSLRFHEFSNWVFYKFVSCIMKNAHRNKICSFEVINLLTTLFSSRRLRRWRIHPISTF